MIACPKSRLAILAALTLSLLISPTAQAGNWDFKGGWGPNLTGIETALAGILVLDAGFGIYDLTMAGIGRPAAKGAAIAELILSVPQVVVGTAGVVSALQSSDKGSAVAFGVLTLLPLGLSIHGITTLTNANQTSEPIRTREAGVSAPHSEWLDSLQLRPTVIVAQRAAVPALSLGFRF